MVPTICLNYRRLLTNRQGQRIVSYYFYLFIMLTWYSHRKVIKPLHTLWRSIESNSFLINRIAAGAIFPAAEETLNRNHYSVWCGNNRKSNSHKCGDLWAFWPKNVP